MMKEPKILVSTNVDVSKRIFKADPNGPEIAMDGTRGHYGDWEIQEVCNLLTNAGRDFLHLQGYQTSGLGTNGGNYIALTSDSAAAAATDTTLTGEITNLGLNRQQGTLAHTVGQTTSTITKTFTATGTSNAVQKTALFTLSSNGTMVHEATFSSVNLANNDQLQIQWTVTLS